MKYGYQIDREGKCLECGNKIVYGRKDKKFCCQSCKNHYHNRVNYMALRMRDRVAAAIKENYRVLSWAIDTGRSNVPLNEMTMMGFNSAFYTSCKKTGRHVEYTCCDIVFCMSANKVYKIRREN